MLNKELIKAELHAIYDAAITAGEISERDSDWHSAILTKHPGIAKELFKEDRLLEEKAAKVVDIMVAALKRKDPEKGKFAENVIAAARKAEASIN